MQGLLPIPIARFERFGRWYPRPRKNSHREFDFQARRFKCAGFLCSALRLTETLRIVSRSLMAEIGRLCLSTTYPLAARSVRQIGSPVSVVPYVRWAQGQRLKCGQEGRVGVWRGGR